MALEQFEDEDGNPMFLDPLDVRRVWGGGGEWKNKMTLVALDGGGECAVKGPVAEVGPRIKRLQDAALAAEDRCEDRAS